MNAALVLAVSVPLTFVLATLSVLRRASERALVLPAPTMIWLVFMAQRATTAPWYAVLIAHTAAFVVLGGCLGGKRRLAQCGAICCGAAALWLQLSGAFDHSSG
jgi:hypothetical protein